MTYNLIVKSLAEKDIAEAVEWYADRSKKLGRRFINATDAALKNIVSHPHIFQKRYSEIRVVFIQHFPYGIYYTVEQKTIFVHAVFHTKRNPRTAIERI